MVDRKGRSDSDSLRDLVRSFIYGAIKTVIKAVPATLVAIVVGAFIGAFLGLAFPPAISLFAVGGAFALGFPVAVWEYILNDRDVSAWDLIE
jgi:ABC-type dipeptide/oligopeptide/nickel transport system permease subunit